MLSYIVQSPSRSYPSTQSMKALTMWLRQGMFYLFTHSNISMFSFQSLLHVLWNCCCASFLVLSFHSPLVFTILCFVTLYLTQYTLRVWNNSFDCDRYAWVQNSKIPNELILLVYDSECDRKVCVCRLILVMTCEFGACIMYITYMMITYVHITCLTLWTTVYIVNLIHLYWSESKFFKRKLSSTALGDVKDQFHTTGDHMTSHMTSFGAQLKQECSIQAIITHITRHQELPQHKSTLVKGISNYVLVGTSTPELCRWTAISILTDNTLHLFNTTQGLVTHTPNNQNEILPSLVTWCHVNLSRDVRHDSVRHLVWQSVWHLVPTLEPIQSQPLAQYPECAELCHGYYV